MTPVSDPSALHDGLTDVTLRAPIDLARLAACPRLERLDARHARLPGAAWLQLPLLPALQSLDLRGAALDAAGLAHLARLPALTALRLGETRGALPAEALRALVARGGWRVLDLHAQPGLTEEVLAALAASPELSTLVLGAAPRGLAGRALQQLELPALTRFEAWMARSFDCDGLLDWLGGHPRLAHLVIAGGSAERTSLAGFRAPALAHLYLQLGRHEEPGLLPALLSGLPRLEELRLHSVHARDAVAELVAHPTLEHLWLHTAGLDDEALVGLCAHPWRHLSFIASSVGAEGLAAVAGLSSLEELSLQNHRPVSAELMAQLAALPRLRVLTLDHSDVDDAGLAALRQAPALERLSFDWAKAITTEGARALSGHPTLRRLAFGGTAVDALDWLTTLPALDDLSAFYLKSLPIEAYDGLAALTGLTRLNLQGAPIGDAALTRLAEALPLEWCGLWSCPELSPDGVQALRRARPGCRINAETQLLATGRVPGQIELAAGGDRIAAAAEGAMMWQLPSRGLLLRPDAKPRRVSLRIGSAPVATAHSPQGLVLLGGEKTVRALIGLDRPGTPTRAGPWKSRQPVTSCALGPDGAHLALQRDERLWWGPLAEPGAATELARGPGRVRFLTDGRLLRWGREGLEQWRDGALIAHSDEPVCFVTEAPGGALLVRPDGAVEPLDSPADDAVELAAPPLRLPAEEQPLHLVQNALRFDPGARQARTAGDWCIDALHLHTEHGWVGLLRAGGDFRPPAVPTDGRGLTGPRLLVGGRLFVFRPVGWNDFPSLALSADGATLWLTWRNRTRAGTTSSWPVRAFCRPAG